MQGLDSQTRNILVSPHYWNLPRSGEAGHYIWVLGKGGCRRNMTYISCITPRIVMKYPSPSHELAFGICFSAEFSRIKGGWHRIIGFSRNITFQVIYCRLGPTIVCGVPHLYGNSLETPRKADSSGPIPESWDTTDKDGHTRARIQGMEAGR